MDTFRGLLACPLAAMLTPEPAQPLLHTLALSPCEAHCPWAPDQETPLGLPAKPGELPSHASPSLLQAEPFCPFPHQHSRRPREAVLPASLLVPLPSC